ncbi:MAG: hypothetical protein C0514_01180 [Candidatus Puniceispirillum sp.]|nr:hypothetical protein [Candidatus Puniceispirillum sp.]
MGILQKDFDIKHPLLKTQLDRINILPEDAGVVAFIKDVDTTYQESDEERRFLETTMEVMSKEVMEVNEDLLKRADELAKLQERYFLVAAAANDGIWDWDVEKDVVYYSSRFQEMIDGVAHTMCTMQEWFDLVHPDDIDYVKKQVNRHLNDETPRISLECRLRGKGGHERWFLINGLASRDENGKVKRVAGSQTDISQRKEYEASLYKAAYFDELTGLYNRGSFISNLEQVIATKKRLGEMPAALIFLDLDRFKQINDTLGHACGDEVLKRVAQILRTNTRPTDIIARLGGDEFTMILNPIESMDEALEITQRILTALNKNHTILNNDIYLSASIGASLIDNTRMSADTILRNADLAMYEAKQQGKARVEIFDRAQHDRLLQRMRLETDLRKAIEMGELEMYYQPIINLDTGYVASFEALMRWHHPQMGFVSPGLFIPMAEEAGLINALGQWCLETVIKQVKHWHSKRGDECPKVSINVSVKQLMDDAAYNKMMTTLKRMGKNARFIGIEVTESVIVGGQALILRRLKEIHDMGILLSLDDFGTGYSSLSHLHVYPFDIIKVDQSFVASMTIDKKSERMVHSIIKLGHDLELRIVAEGIETVEQMIMLQSSLCHYGQGYLFAKPLPSQNANHVVLGNQRYDTSSQSLVCAIGG